MLQVGKKDVSIAELDPVGAYAVRPVFSDGHDTGIFSWDYFYTLGTNQDEMWRRYLHAHRGGRREPRSGGGRLAATAEMQVDAPTCCRVADIAPRAGAWG